MTYNAKCNGCLDGFLTAAAPGIQYRLSRIFLAAAASRCKNSASVTMAAAYGSRPNCKFITRSTVALSRQTHIVQSNETQWRN